MGSTALPTQIPTSFRHKLRAACLRCRLVKTYDQMPEFCSGDCSQTVNEIFGVAAEDAAKIRMHPISEGGDLDSLRKMVDGSDSEGLDHE